MNKSPNLNGKPYRPKVLKEQAKNTARKNSDGYFTSSVPLVMHKPTCEPQRCMCRVGRSILNEAEEPST